MNYGGGNDGRNGEPSGWRYGVWHANPSTGGMQTPVQVIAGKVSDALSFKLQRCVEKVPEVLMDMGLMDWSEFTHFGYDSKPIERSSLLMYEDITGGVAGMTKPNPKCRLSHSQADMLAKAARAVARGYLGMPAEPSSPSVSHRTTMASPQSKTESQLSTDAARMSVFSNLKSSEKLETVYGPGRPAHVHDVMTYIDETTKALVGMQGYEAMQTQMELRKHDAALELEMLTDRDNAAVQTDEWKQQTRLLYQGIPSQYKKDVLSKSRYAKVLFDPGVLPFACMKLR